jgi:hypothetical protein
MTGGIVGDAVSFAAGAADSEETGGVGVDDGVATGSVVA